VREREGGKQAACLAGPRGFRWAGVKKQREGEVSEVGRGWRWAAAGMLCLGLFCFFSFFFQNIFKSLSKFKSFTQIFTIIFHNYF
jgi:hypothetical protein